MPQRPIERSRILGPALRRRREELRLTLRDMVLETERAGRPIPYSTLAKIETGEIEPGVLRFHQLLKLYQLPMQAAQDLLDLEEIAEELPDSDDVDQLVIDGRALLERGQLGAALAHFMAARQRPASSPFSKAKADIAFTATCCTLGKFRLALHVLEDVIVSAPDNRVLTTAYVQAAMCWDAIGSPDAALGFLDRAEVHLPRGEPKIRAWLFHKKATVLCALGETDAATRCADSATRAYRAAGEAFGGATLAGVRIRLVRESGDDEASLRLARRARRDARVRGHERLHIHRTLDEARALVRLDRADEAIPLLEFALSKAIAMQDRAAQFYGHYDLALAFEQLGVPERARAEMDAARHFVRYVDESTPETRRFKEES